MFSCFNKDKTPEDDIETTFQITEQMTLEDLPDAIADQFYSLFKTIETCNAEMTKIENEQNNGEKENDMRLAKDIKNEAENQLFYGIISMGHQVDNGKKTLKEYISKLEESKQDLKSFDGIKTFPTPFFIRYSNQLENLANSISEEIISYASHLQSLSSNTNNDNNSQNNVIVSFLKEEHDAILRESTRVARLNKKLNKTRLALCEKLNIQHSELVNPVEDVTDSLANSVERKYFQFRESQKSKILRNQQDANLFGQPTTIIAEPAKQNAGSKMTITTSNFGQAKKDSKASQVPGAPTPDQKSPFSTK